MTTQRNSFTMEIASPLYVSLPTTLVEAPYLTAQVTLRDREEVLHTWMEQDLNAAIHDLYSRTGLALGEHGYLDVLFHGTQQVRLLIWTDGCAAPRHVIDLDEAAYFGAIDEMRRTVAALDQSR
jgi:hypothetical protein